MEKQQKVAIAAIGSWGDVYPFILMGRDLQKHGISVTIGASARYENEIKKYGLGYHEIIGDLEWSISNTKEGKDIFRNPSLFKMSAIKNFMKPLTEDWFKSIHSLSKSTNLLIITNTSLLAGFSAIESSKNLRSILINLQPSTPSRYYAPPALSGASWSWFNWINIIKWKAVYSGVWSMWRNEINELRRIEMNLSPVTLGYLDHINSIANKPSLTLTAYSEYLFDRPPDWPEKEHIIGPIMSEDDQKYLPTIQVEQFLAKGSAPIYIGIGSMMNCMFDAKQQRNLVTIWIDSINYLNKRAIINLAGFEGIDEFLSSIQPQQKEKCLFLSQNIPHSWLFPKCIAVVHHGGTGTMHSGLYYGLPTLILYVGSDQPFNGDLVYRKKLGPAPLAAKKITFSRFANALNVLTREEFVQNANQFAKKMRSEQGLTKAVEYVINELKINSQ